jgi:hypothetical protein
VTPAGGFDKEFSMKKNKSIGTVLVLLAALAGLLAYAAAPDITGTWIGKTEVPNAGLDDLTLVIKKTPTGFSGTFSDTLGQLNKDTEIKDVKLEGNLVTFNFPIIDGTVLQGTLKIDGDKMSGAWSHPEGSGADWTFERKK